MFIYDVTPIKFANLPVFNGLCLFVINVTVIINLNINNMINDIYQHVN